MTRVLLVPDLPLERWPSMDRYAHRLYDWLESTDHGFEVRLAAQIGALTRETKDGRRSGGYPRWWAQDVDPTSLVLPGPLRDPQRYVARHFFYPWWLKRDAKRARLVHILDHSYAHMVTRVHRRPVVVTVHDLMPVIILRSPTDGWREGIRNRFLRQTLKALRLAQSYIVGTEWLKHELATWLGDDRRISVVPFGVRRSRSRGVGRGASGRGVRGGGAEGGGRRGDRRGRGAGPRGVRAGARVAVGRSGAHGAVDRPRARAGARILLAKNRRADGGGVSHPALSVLGNDAGDGIVRARRQAQVELPKPRQAVLRRGLEPHRQRGSTLRGDGHEQLIVQRAVLDPHTPPKLVGCALGP